MALSEATAETYTGASCEAREKGDEESSLAPSENNADSDGDGEAKHRIWTNEKKPYCFAVWGLVLESWCL